MATADIARHVLLEEEEDDSTSPSARRITEEERAIVNKCIDVVERRAKSLEERGLTKWNFMFGVANSLGVAWSFGAIPEHFWIIYLLEIFILFPVRWQHQIAAKPLKENLYWLDFCWMANFSAVLLMCVLTFDHGLNDDVRKWFFSAAWGLSNGPLLLATGCLGNALVFHDFDNTASVIIHLFPSLVMFVMGWHYGRVQAAWPSLFKVGDYFSLIDPWRDIYCNAATVYSVWLLLYTGWMTACGLTAPKTGYDTVFHMVMRGGGGKIVAKIDNNFTVTYVLAYMLLHAVSVYVAILVSLLCYVNQYFHGCLCGAMAFMTIYNAASRYTFYMVSSYGQALRKELGIPYHRKASAMRFVED
ncbi:unnamed protein product [Polarella glacialis]|uniref:Glycerophosphocholine acyltransferase 1 n=1 Tax=Polarella glacialis TaxID=89957 RepID=A0A813FMM9_POLGL|nr:unnamed protein product [Polarella glacialis]